jgi:hypothetical protein
MVEVVAQLHLIVHRGALEGLAVAELQHKVTCLVEPLFTVGIVLLDKVIRVGVTRHLVLFPVQDMVAERVLPVAANMEGVAHRSVRVYIAI